MAATGVHVDTEHSVNDKNMREQSVNDKNMREQSVRVESETSAAESKLDANNKRAKKPRVDAVNRRNANDGRLDANDKRAKKPKVDAGKNSSRKANDGGKKSGVSVENEKNENGGTRGPWFHKWSSFHYSYSPS